MIQKKIEKFLIILIKKGILGSLLIDLIAIAIFDLFIILSIKSKGIPDYYNVVVMLIFNNIIFLSLFDLVFNVQSLGKALTFTFVCKDNRIVIQNWKLIIRRLINTLLLPLTFILILFNKKTVGDYIFKTELKALPVTNNFKLCYKKVFSVLVILLFFNIIYTFTTQVNYQKTMFINAIIDIILIFLIFNSYVFRIVKRKLYICWIILFVFFFLNSYIFQGLIPQNINHKNNDSRFEYYFPKVDVIYNYDNDYSSVYIYTNNNKIGIANVLESNWVDNIRHNRLIKFNQELKYAYGNGIIVFSTSSNNNYNIENKFGETAERIEYKNKLFYILYLKSNKMIYDFVDKVYMCDEENRNQIITINDSKYKFDACFGLLIR